MTSSKDYKPRMVYVTELLEYNLEKFMGNDCPGWYKWLFVSFLILPFLVRFGIPFLGVDFEVTMANIGPLHIKASMAAITTTILIMFEAITLLMLNKKNTPATAPILFLVPLALFGTGVASSQGYVAEVSANLSVLLLVLTVGSTASNLKDPIGIPVSLIIQKWGKCLYKTGAAVFLMSAIGSAFLDQITMLFIMIGGLSSIYYVVKNSGNFNQEEMTSINGVIRMLIYTAFMGSLIGGTATPIGEPQCYRIAEILGITDFGQFFMMMYMIFIGCGLALLTEILILTRFRIGEYAFRWPDSEKLSSTLKENSLNLPNREKASNYIQLGAFLVFVLALLLLAAHINIFFLGMVAFGGMMMLQGKNREHYISHSTGEVINLILVLLALYGIATALAQQGIILWIVLQILALPFFMQLLLIFLAAGMISSFSDNVFVATIMVTALLIALGANVINMTAFVSLTIAMLAGTTLFSFFLPIGNAGGLCILMHPFCNEEIGLDFKKMFLFGLPLIPVMAIVSLIIIVITFYFGTPNMDIVNQETIMHEVEEAMHLIGNH
ncbi:SLC13 family permease [Minisyncoccus archaeiphilus]|uniref:SLC13 family permease n=1 Tax=Minisyncoccus archaeiphilus TaxID=3238481 RepID=UPI00399C5CC0